MNTYLLILLLLGGGLAIYAGLIEPRLVELRYQPVLISRLSQSLAGFRILHLSDLHLKDSHRGKARRLLRICRETRPDLVLITGDLIDHDSNRDYCARFLARLRSNDGVYCVLGNHDHFRYTFADTWTGKKTGSGPNDVQALREALEERDVKVLTNEMIRLKVNSEALYLIGADEFAEGFEDVDQILADVPPEDMVLVLVHRPDAMSEIQLRSPALALAGHTHGGQIRLPGFGALIPHTKVLDRKSNSGLTTLNGTPTHVSRGFGSSQWLPFRFLCRPEVTLLTLKRI